MTKNKWIYWHSGDPLPSALPEGCEFDMQSERWIASCDDPCMWPDGNVNVRRWPATEAEEKVWHWCLAHSISVPDGYKVVGFGQEIETGEEYLTRFGSIETWRNFRDNLTFPHPILREREPEIQWVTPTDEHARLRPDCEVKNENGSEWRGATLLAVMRSGSTPYRVTLDWNTICAYDQCRVDARLLEGKE